MKKQSTLGNLKAKNTILIYNTKQKAVYITRIKPRTRILRQSIITTHLQQTKQQSKHLENNRQNH